MIFNRWKKTVKPICLHEWYLVYTYIDEIYNGYDVEFDKKYEIGCVRCDEVRTLNENGYYHFRSTFEVKGSKG